MIVAVGRGVGEDVGRDDVVREGPGVAEGTGRGVAVAERCVLAAGARVGVAGALDVRPAVGDEPGCGGTVPVGWGLGRGGAEVVEIATSPKLMRPLRANPTRGIRSLATSLCPRCTTIQKMAPTTPHRLRKSSTAKTTKSWCTIIVLRVNWPETAHPTA